MPRSSRIHHLSPASLLAVSASIILPFSAAQTCYVAQNGGVQKASSWKSCPGSAADGFETCCLPGSECGEDMLCHIPSTFSPGENQWYQAGCTDPTYQSSQCRKNCVYYSNPYVQYLTSSDEWNCCGDYGCNGTATQFSFKAAAPGVITQIASLNGSPSTTTLPSPPTSSSKPTHSTRSKASTTVHHASSSAPAKTTSASSTSPTTTGTTPHNRHTTSTHRRNTNTHHRSTTPALASNTPSSSTTASSSLGNTQNQSNGGLSSGAKIGIGAAIGATGALAILAAIVACFVFRVRRRRSPEEMIGMKHMSDTQSSPSYRASGRQSELAGPINGYNAPRSAPNNYNDTAAFLASGTVAAPAAVAAAAPPVPRQPDPSEYQRQTFMSEAPPMSPTGMAFNDPRGTRDWQSIKSSRHLSSVRTTRDYRFEDLPSRRDSIRTTRDYRFFAPEDENVPPLP